MLCCVYKCFSDGLSVLSFSAYRYFSQPETNTSILSNGYINEREKRDYINLLSMASARIFSPDSQYHKEVLNVTKSSIILPSQLEDIIAEKDKQLAEKDSKLAEKENKLAEQAVIIAQLQEQLTLANLSTK